MWRLTIGLTQSYQEPAEGTRSWGTVNGGPRELLRWLETQLGLSFPQVSASNRVTQYAQALERAKSGSSYQSSFESDRWTTAETLLLRRDELLLAGWCGAPEGAPPIVNDLARVEGESIGLHPGLPERLDAVLSALKTGQCLPPHQCVLLDPVCAWPPLWRQILAKLTLAEAEAALPRALPTSSLEKLQRQILSGKTGPVQLDDSVSWVVCRSRLTACDLVAHLLSNRTLLLGDVTILCEDESMSILLDGCLANAGLPTTGAISRNPFHPVLQVLPLAIRLLWEPVDPQVLLDFLTLPVGPIHRRAAEQLARALAEQPGFRSDAWERTVSSLCSPENDPDGLTRARLTEWFDIERFKWGQPLPAQNIGECCRRISAWSAGYSQAVKGANEPEKAALSGPLLHLAECSSCAQELVLTQAGTVSEPQLGRILAAAQQRALSPQTHSAVAGGPRLVSSLQEVTGPCSHLIWLGLGTSDSGPTLWSRADLETLRQHGVELDDGSNRLECLRQAERRGFSGVSESLLAIHRQGGRQ